MKNLRILAAALAAAALLSDCGGGGAGYGGGGGGGGGTTTYTIGGTVAGLSPATSVVLANGADMATVSANGGFTFPTGLAYTAPYNVTVQTQPTDRTCVVINSIGNVGFANVTNVTVACTSNTSAPASGDLVITEVLAGAPAAQEWFEVANTNASSRDLGGVVVTRGTGLFVVPAGTSIPAGAFFVFAASSDSTANGGLPAVNVNYGSSLQLVNTNFSMSVSVAGTVVDSVSFTGSMPSAASLALSESHTDPTANDTQTNWCTSTTAYGTAGNKGTPGAANSDCP